MLKQLRRIKLEDSAVDRCFTIREIDMNGPVEPQPNKARCKPLTKLLLLG